MSQTNLYQKGKKKIEDINRLTIWDLPADISHRKIESMCRSIENARVIRIKRSQFKALAIIETTNRSYMKTPWSLPLDDSKLV